MEEEEPLLLQPSEGFVSFLVPENKRVVEIGCGTGDLPFKLKPSYGLGIDISEK